MNPDVNPQIKFDLPKPATEVPMPIAQAESLSAPTAEALGLKLEAQPSIPGAQGAALPFSPSLEQMSPASGSSQTLPTADAGSAPAAAGHSDLIEKEWVAKAKQIIVQTKADPYQQNQQLAALKADYIQRHYGKTVKLS